MLLLLRVIIAACFLANLVAPAPASAADAAERNLIGFSSDGKWFAFEEFGVEDGSGFPYSSIYIIDTDKDQWANGSPFRVRIEDERASLRQARHRSLAAASGTLKRLDVSYPPSVLATNAPGEVTADPLSFRFKRYHNIHDLWVVRAEKVSTTRPRNCSEEDEVYGVALAYGRAGSPVEELYRDVEIPSSRGCPIDYQLADVVAFYGSGAPRFVVLLHVHSRGFEGMNSRYLAIPLRKLPRD